MKRIFAVIIAFIVLLCSFALVASGEAEHAATIWDGTIVLKSNSVYEVTSSLTITDKQILPVSSALVIKKNGSLTVSDSGKLYINGKIIVEKGGTLRSESFIRFSLGSSAEINGTLSVREQGQLIVNGNMTVSESGKLYNYGELTSGKSSEIDMNGNIYNKENSSITLSGEMSVDGAITSYGTITAKKSALLTVSGKLLISKNAELNLKGKDFQLTIEKGGSVAGKGIINRASVCSIKTNGKLKINLNKMKTEIIDGVTYVGGILIVNKEIALPSNYNYGVDSTALKAYRKMQAAAVKAGFELPLRSSFRSYELQATIFRNYGILDSVENARMYSAEAGHSEHQSGLAFDTENLEESYGDTAEGKWLAANCYKYGFIIRYPDGKTDITGYNYEPWHVRYLGVDIATAVYGTGLCLEEFLGID